MLVERLAAAFPRNRVRPERERALFTALLGLDYELASAAIVDVVQENQHLPRVGELRGYYRAHSAARRRAREFEALQGGREALPETLADAAARYGAQS